VARGGTTKERSRANTRELPPPLPPQTRTVGQLVAETIRTYGKLFLPAMLLGVPIAVANFVTFARHEARDVDVTGDATKVALALLALSPLATLAYAYACTLVTGRRPPLRNWLVALAAGTVVFVPAAFLAGWFALAAVAWLGALGMVVPVAMLELRPFREVFGRAWSLARADLVHAIGGLAAITVVFVVTRYVLAFLLRSQADNTLRLSLLLADIVLSPLLFLGGVLVYEDQRARIGSAGRRQRRRDAALPDADHAHREGRADAQVESGPSS
jgi:hypothetical protein